MIRLLVLVEGETEETFVNEVLAPYLHSLGFESVSARILGNARQRERRGGIRGWDGVLKEIVSHLKSDSQCIVTTMVDYYGLPRSGVGAWPRRLDSEDFAGIGRADLVESEMQLQVDAALGISTPMSRFVPFVVLHEFEGLLFSDCGLFAEGINRPELAAPLQSIRDSFSSPEEINDSPATCPSARIRQLFPGYQKPLMGSLAAINVTLDRIRGSCPHFDGWLSRLVARAGIRHASDTSPPGVP